MLGGLGLGCPSGVTPRAAAVPRHVPAVGRHGAPGYPRSTRLQGLRQPRWPAPPTQSVLFQAAPRGQRARRHRCCCARCQGAAICVHGAARLGGASLLFQPPHLDPGALQHCRAGFPPKQCPQGFGGAVGRGLRLWWRGRRGRPGCLPLSPGLYSPKATIPTRGHCGWPVSAPRWVLSSLLVLGLLPPMW